MRESGEIQTKLVGLLPHDVPVESMIALADSILAAPILAVIVDNKTKNGDTLVKVLMERGEELLAVSSCSDIGHRAIYLDFVVDPDTPEDAARLLEQGAPGILLSLWLDNNQSMRQTISRAREFRQAILEAVGAV
ncbi:MAG: hypothetical protein ACI85U_004238 [Candidatus Promineifilaceae bacterium]|jgi:hypothetical protein